MPASRSSRKAIKRANVATAAEWRLRAEMGEDVFSPEQPLSLPERQRRSAERAALREAFTRLPRAERRRRADEFKRKLRPLCASARAFEGAWTGAFMPLLSASDGGERRPSASFPPTERQQAAKRSPTPAASTGTGSTNRREARPAGAGERAARALDVRLRAARPAPHADLRRLAHQLNADPHFVAAFGGRVSEDHIRLGIKNLGRYRSGGRTKRDRTT